ncbi:MAG: MerR family transcriptional regulator [Gammaproteobacteria bacterium]
MSQPTRKSSSESEFFPIGTVSSLTGVNSITLRAWERRYGLIDPVRTESGHRLYSRDDIDLINRVVGLTEKGMRIGQVRGELAAQGFGPDAVTEEIRGPWPSYQRRMIASIIRFDEASLEEAYNEALSLYPVNVVTRELLSPLLVELGERWQSGLGSVAEEHFFGFYLRNKLGARFHHRHGNNSGPRLLVACLPGDLHEIGLLLFALAAHEHGYQLVLLGANLPLTEIPAAVRQAQCHAAVLSGCIGPDPKLLTDDLPKLTTQASFPVLIGGPISVTHCDELKAAGSLPLGDDLERGLTILNEACTR